MATTATTKKTTATKKSTTAKSTTPKTTTKPATTVQTEATTAQITALQNEVASLRQEITAMKEVLAGPGGSDSSRISALEEKLNGLGQALRDSLLARAQVSKTWKLRGFLDDLGL